ncbi:MAG: hemolysin family protein [Inquilinaceae bacterium]
MTESSISRSARPVRAEDTQPTPRIFRSWLRAALTGKSESSWRDTIEELLEDSEEPSQDVASHERMLLTNILRLKDLTAIDVMVPRADIVAVEVETALPDILRLVAARAHSRIPVYRESLDDIVGMLHIKDVLATVVDNRDVKTAELLRDVIVVAPSMPVLDLLLEMRQARQHMALVVDEFGGIDGLITIEDLVEEIVGDIEDEHDTDEPPQFEERPDGSFVVDARLPMEEFEARLGPILEEDERDDIDTVGGLVFAIAGRIPARGELLNHPAGLEFEVTEADPRRIRRLRVRHAAAVGDPNRE